MAIILAMLAILFFWPFGKPTELSAQEKERILTFQQKIDSLKKLKELADNPKIFPFNPNFITDYKGYTLGLSVEEIDRLHAFREKGEWINSNEDFQKVTKISDSLLAKISPFFKFPDWVKNQNNFPQKWKKDEIAELPFSQKQDLNKVTNADLEKIVGIGPAISRRIIRYRTKLNGFVNDIQLKDIYGLDYETTQRLLAEFTVKDTLVQKISINKATVAQLSDIVYFDYEMARKIVEYRTLHDGITSFEELTKIDGFPAYQIERIQLYLTL
ncbi:MAG TPA: helix-hairpin-helix domain-containing protein [Flavobacteriaceae bacterium]|nr:helix-hairpin-helix domain-containing protein [Flavobacteriaceae bacterium]